MSRYTYTLNPCREERKKHTYKQSELEKMTTFHLREICQKEHLVVSSIKNDDKDGLIRFIMRFRGQKEYRHIKEFCDGGKERLEAFLKRQSVCFSEVPRIDISGTITIFEHTEMNERDGYEIHSEEKLFCGNLLLTDETLKIYTCFYIEQSDGKFYLFKGKNMPVCPLSKHQYSILYFPNETSSEFLYDCYYGNDVFVPGYTQAVRIPLLDIAEKKMTQAAFPLVIDFGSSNTTMGICLPDGTVQIAAVKGKTLIPSMIGVQEKTRGETEFLFGFGALEKSRQTYKDEDIAVFYDVKRWVSDAERMESVILKSGYKYQFSRKEMLRAFFDYLLELSSQQFKCTFTNIQLLAPIRQKEKFARLFKELLCEYQVNCELDEGMAVLFHSIQNLITAKRYEENKWYHALVIDCGGGTTDLTSGRFRIENHRVSYIIDLETRYENGDTNLGGNNLTYRILQFLKIRLVEELGFLEKETLLIEDEKEETVSYEQLKKRYLQAEKWLPTQFKQYEGKSREQYFYVKNNYYYLFELAEQIKKMFFQSGFCYELKVSAQKGADIFLDKWKLSFCQKQDTTAVQFETFSETLEFDLYLYEMEALLRPEIYGLMERFLDSKFENGELWEYEMIKLTGQSCKSRLFLEALKQYVPGKRIQGVRRDHAKTELKMCCLQGALAYFQNCKLGYMKMNESYGAGSLPYEIMAYTHENKQKVLIHSQDRQNAIGYISRFHIGNQLDLYLNDDQGKHLRTYYFAYDTSKFEKTTQKEIEQNYKKTVIQEETDIILEGEMKFFVWVCRERWGFFVLPVLREGEQLYKGEETFFDFEDDTWELNFFDGRK